MTLTRPAGLIAFVGMEGGLGIGRRSYIMYAFRGVAADTVGRIISPQLENPIVDGLLVGLNRLSPGPGKSHDRVKVPVGMTARTELHNLQGRAAGLEFETV